MLKIFPVRGHGVCSQINRETLLELRSELRLDALPVTTIDFFWGLNPRLTVCKSCILTAKTAILRYTINFFLNGFRIFCSLYFEFFTGSLLMYDA